MIARIGYLKNESTNLGDAIQSLAAKKIIQSLGMIAVGFNKDELLGRSFPSGEVNAVLVNGWFTKDEFNRLINGEKNFPKIVAAGIHISDWDGTGERIDKRAKKHGELDIGARDSGTKRLLVEAHYKSWISGCLTTTLSLTNPIDRNRLKSINSIDRVAFVDISISLPDKSLANYDLTRFTHNECDSRRFTEEDAEKRIREYLDFDIIVTRRLHCALPLVGYGQRVLFYGDTKDYRVEPITTTGCKIKWYPSYRRELSGYKRLLSTAKRKWWSKTAAKGALDWIRENSGQYNTCHWNMTSGNSTLLDVVSQRLRNAAI